VYRHDAQASEGQDPAAGAEHRKGDKSGGFASSVARPFTGLAGLKELRGFSLRALFGEVFSHHHSEDIEEFFTSGSPKTTPAIEALDSAWPKPWIFFRAFLATLLVYLLFHFAWQAFENITLLPGLIFTGSFAIPLSTIIFFLEINVRRNVSVYQVIKLIVVGGVVSFIFSLVLFAFSDVFTLELLGTSIAGLIEEPGKVFALLIVASLPRYKYILNGLLFGAAVGAGFAAFESAGYAFYSGVVESDHALMTTTILLRGLLSPMGHIAWSAMCGAALWKVKGDRLFSFKMLLDLNFLRILAIASVLHMFWNVPLQLPFFGRYLIVGAMGWLIVLGFIGEGLAQIAAEREEKL
jgi:RsiW-degrading membrane proteinase PrsW (M82 family)